MARLVIISNRVPVPGQRGQAAGGLAVALHNAAHQRDCLWFGWSGNVTNRETPLAPRIAQSGRIAFATIDLAHADYQGYYRGFANGMLWPLLHSRVGLSEFRRTEFAAYLAVNSAFATRWRRCCNPMTRSGCTTITCFRSARPCAMPACAA